MTLHRPYPLWHGYDGECEIVVELHDLTPLVGAAGLLVAHLSGATAVTATLLIAALTLILAAGLWTWQMARHLRAHRRLEARWIQVGDLVEERFTLSNTSFLPALWVSLNDESDIPGYNAGSVRAVAGHAETRWTHSGTATRRGEFHLGPWALETGDPFGLLLVRIRYPHARPLLVYPPVADWPFPPLPRGASPGAARINRTAPTPTVNAGQVRAYERGDPFRHIHWPSTARRDELIVKMFDQEASSDVWLVLDTDPAVQSGEGDSATEEVMVLVAASLAAHFLQEGRAVGLCLTAAPPQARSPSASLHLTRPSRGTGHLWTLLGELARLPNAALRQRPAHALVHALDQIARLWRAGANLVIITPSADPAWLATLPHLAWRQMLPSIILIDPAPEGRPTREHLMALLAGQGLVCRSVRCDVPLVLRPVLGRTRRWEFKTLATGRIVTMMESVR